MSRLDTPLTPADVTSIYREFLEREPLAREVDLQVERCRTAGELLDVVRASEEYEMRLRMRGKRPEVKRARVNIWHPDLAEHTHPPGTVSDDGTAIVGREGWIFIKSGTNSTLEQHRGEDPPPARWLDAWMDVLEVRRREARELGVRLACVVVPDKLALHEEQFPEPIEPRGPRPALRLCERAGDALAYPLSELRAARADGEVALRTDTHLTVHGNRVLAACVLHSVGARGSVPSPQLRQLLMSGDLGMHFEPQILELRGVVGSFGAAAVVDDNREAIQAVGGHVGTCRVLRNPAAPDPRVAVLLGDSYGFADTYYQGLGWWLAQVFAELHFLWVPFGWDPAYLADVGAQVAILQTAERFVGRVPLERVDVRALARETIEGGHGLDLDAFCRVV